MGVCVVHFSKSIIFYLHLLKGTVQSLIYNYIIIGFIIIQISIALRLQNSQISEYGKLRYGIDGYGLADKTLARHSSTEFHSKYFGTNRN